MQCVYCGNELTANAKFCVFCGKPVLSPVRKEGVCANCGNAIIPGNKFCIFCGAKIENTLQQTQKEPEIPKEPLCANCGAKLYEGQKFCIVCGRPTGMQGTPAAKQQIQKTQQIQQTQQDVPRSAVSVKGRPYPEADTEPETTLLCEETMETMLLCEETTLLSPRRYLVLTNREHPELQYSSPIEGEVTIGRARDCNIVISNESAISRLHCRVILKGDQLYVSDARSANGTYLHNTRIPADQQILFHSGDIFRLGRYEYSFELKTE